MNSAIKNAFIFTIGAAIGSVATYKLLENRFKQITQEEIDSMEEYYKKKYCGEPVNKLDDDVKENTDSGVKFAVTTDKPDILKYAAKLQESGYTNYSGSNVNTEKEEKESMEPYVIAPEDFAEFDEYDTISLTYYSDHVLTDENDELIEDVDAVVGSDSLNHFGEYEDDSVYVRDERLKIDYEILFDRRNYSDVYGNDPHQAED